MLEEELGRMNPDMTAIAAFQAKEAEYAQRVSDLEAATAERDNVSWHCMLQHRRIASQWYDIVQHVCLSEQQAHLLLKHLKI